MQDVSDSDASIQALTWLNAPISFVQRPDPISPDFRLERRIALCLLIIEKVRAGKASWKTVHVLNWALESSNRLAMLANIRTRSELLDEPIVRFEPALDFALDLAVGLGFIRRSGTGLFVLAEKGKAALTEIYRAGVLEEEINALTTVTGKISNRDVERLLEWRAQ